VRIGIKATTLTKQQKNILHLKKFDIPFDLSSHGEGLATPVTPPYELDVLQNTVISSSALAQCITVYMSNIETTGHILSEAEGESASNKDIQDAEDFLSEPMPGKSFITARSKLRKNIETFGWAGMVVLEDEDKDISTVKILNTQYLSLGSKNALAEAEIEILRRGVIKKVLFKKIYKSYCSMAIGTKPVYYREFGSPPTLNSETGRWNDNTPEDKIAQEIIIFHQGLFKEDQYPLPRWLGQTRSILGLDKSEQLNFEFLNNDGVPPGIIFLLNGVALKADQISSLLDSGGPNRLGIIEIESSSGSLDSASRAGVQVERFGSEKTNDSLYQNYIKDCTRKIRSAFRLPDVFFGELSDLKFSNAVVAYKTTEKQVFKPLRRDFDEVINSTIMRRYFPGVKYKSKDLEVDDIETKLKILEFTKDSQAITEESKINSYNEIAELNLEQQDIPVIVDINKSDNLIDEIMLEYQENETIVKACDCLK
jgi:capsid portal protein